MKVSQLRGAFYGRLALAIPPEPRTTVATSDFKIPSLKFGS